MNYNTPITSIDTNPINSIINQSTNNALKRDSILTSAKDSKKPYNEIDTNSLEYLLNVDEASFNKLKQSIDNLSQVIKTNVVDDVCSRLGITQEHDEQTLELHNYNLNFTTHKPTVINPNYFLGKEVIIDIINKKFNDSKNEIYN